MFKDTVPGKAKFWRYFIILFKEKFLRYFLILLVLGFVLFILGVLFYAPFKDLAIAFNSKESVPFFAWFVSGGLALLIGSFWLVFYISFEAAKKGIVDLLFKEVKRDRPRFKRAIKRAIRDGPPFPPSRHRRLSSK